MRFLVARDRDGRALATGALVLRGHWAEIKRIWVEEDARGLGLAKKVVAALTAEANKAGVEILKLETGVMSQAALAVYKGAGFRQCAPFGDYQSDPLSVFMEMPLPRDATFR